MTDQPEKTTMPKTVAEAVNKVMAGMKKLPKSEKNQHGGYNFASIDAFLAAMNPLCAEAGLFIVQTETAFETVQLQARNGAQTWLNMGFDFTLVSSAGEMWGPVHRSVMVQFTGAQAFGSAQSYAQKQFMRSLFQIATGDQDDAECQAPVDDVPSGQKSASKRQAQRNTNSGPKKAGNASKEHDELVPMTPDNEPDWAEFKRRACAMLENCTTPEEIGATAEKIKPAMKACYTQAPEIFEAVRSVRDDRLAKLSEDGA